MNDNGSREKAVADGSFMDGVNTRREVRNCKLSSDMGQERQENHRKVQRPGKGGGDPAADVVQ